MKFLHRFANRIKTSKKRITWSKKKIYGVMLDINPLKEHPERIKKIDRKIACNLNYDEIEFPVEGKDFKKIEVQNNVCINVLCDENELVFPIYVSDQKFDLLLLIDDDKSHYVYIKDFNTCFIKQKMKIKNGFLEVVYSILVVKVC